MYKNGCQEREKKSQKNTEKNDPKKQKLKTEESLDNFVAWKGDNFAVTKKLTLYMYFRLMVFDQISDVSHLEYREVVGKGIEN